MRKQAGSAAFAILAVAAYVMAPVSAQTYKADDIIKHFEPATPKLGVTRGLCVGTEAECNRAGHTVATKPPAAFDLVVKFKYNSDVLEPEAKLNLDEFAKALKAPQLGASSFLVEGHTDATGSPSYNLDLSQRRANSVIRYLNERGIDSAKLIGRGYGQTKPVVADPFSGENRRVETRLRVE
jgi:outer membrane protein OmpA-like peptidoglycan-associated protein